MNEEPAGNRVEALFNRAADLPSGERAAFLDNACRGEPALRAEVEALLVCDKHTATGSNLLDRPLLQRSGTNGQAAEIAFGPAASPSEVGTLGPYRVVRLLGEGGMGAVYSAIDTRLDRRVALKVMQPHFAADATAKNRFLREARAAAQIAHDNVVTVYEADERNGVPYIAMQLLEGCTLDDELLKNGEPPLPEVLRIAREAAEGLAAAHQIGLVHRDIKPSNLWLQAPHRRVKVLDFGLAKPLDNQVGVTLTGAVVGTPAYMSPEQARGEKLDHRTDLFSLGAVLYRLSGGRLPFDRPSTMSMLMALGMEEPPPLRELNPQVSRPLAELVHQMLAKKPEARPQSAAEVAARLRVIADGLPLPTAAQQDARHFSRRQFAAVAAAAAFVVAGSGAALIAFKNGNRASTASTGTTLPGAKSTSVPSDATVARPASLDSDRDVAAWENAVAQMDAPDQVTAVKARLKKLNPEFEPASLSARIDNGVVIDVEVGDGTGLNDLSPLHALTGMKGLSLSGRSGGAADLGPLRGLKLESIQSNGCPHKDLSPLAGMPLWRANFWGLATTDLSPLRGMKLVETNLGNSAVKDISVLKGMPLEFVCVNISEVEDLSPLAGAPLTRLFIANTKVKDLTPVAHAPVVWLCMNGTPIEDLTPLLTMRVEALEMDDPEQHISLLRGVSTLKTINHKPVGEVLRGETKISTRARTERGENGT